MKKTVKFLDNYLEEIILVGMMAYFVFATFFQVLARFVLHISAPWTEESARYVFIWMTFLGASYAAKKSSHIRIDILETSLKGKAKEISGLVAAIVFLVFIILMAYIGLGICLTLLERPQTSSVLELPMITVYAALPVGMAMTAFRLIQSLWKNAFARKEERRNS